MRGIDRGLRTRTIVAQQHCGDDRTHCQHRRDHIHHGQIAAIEGLARRIDDRLTIGSGLRCQRERAAHAVAHRLWRSRRKHDRSRVDRRQQAAEEGHGQQAAELVGHLLDRRGHARPMHRRIPDNGGRSHRHGRAHAGPAQHHAGDQPAKAMGDAPGRQHDSQRCGGKTTRDQNAQADLVQKRTAKHRGRQRAERSRRNQQPRLERREAGNELEALRGDELNAADREHGEGRRHHARREGGVAEDREVEQREGQARLAAHEEDARHHGDDKRPGRHQPGLTDMRRFLDRDHQRRQRHERLQRGDQIPWLAMVGLTLRRDDQCREERNDDHRHVDQEDRSPPEMLQQEAADDRAERTADDRQRSPDRNGDVALALIEEGHPDQGQRRRHHRRRADGKKRPGRNQDVGRRREGRDQRSDAKQHQADQEHLPMADAVAERAGAQQQACHHQRIGIDDPQPLRLRSAEFACQRRQRRIENRVIEGDQQQTGGDGHKQHPPVRMRGGHGLAILFEWP